MPPPPQMGGGPGAITWVEVFAVLPFGNRTTILTLTGDQLRQAFVVRLATNDFMYTGGDGYTVLAQGTNVLQPGDGLLDVVVDHIKANSPVSAAIEGRIIEN
jgi:2',3'-cyclic-nucleotide 2'-phosphodiesterase (5'-nucleotidase family)